MDDASLITDLIKLANGYADTGRFKPAADIRAILIRYFVEELDRMEGLVWGNPPRSSQDVLDNIDDLTQELKKYEDDSEAVQDSQEDGESWSER